MKLLLLQLVYIKKEVITVVTQYTLDDLWRVVPLEDVSDLESEN